MDANPDDTNEKATGLAALGEVDDIAIVAMPDAGASRTRTPASPPPGILHRPRRELHYRIAVVDGPHNASMNEIREFRGNFDTKYGALYHPWIEILDPNGAPAPGRPAADAPAAAVRLRRRHLRAQRHRARRLQGAGQRGGLRPDAGSRCNINKAQQDVLNPEGINCFASSRAAASASGARAR